MRKRERENGNKVARRGGDSRQQRGRDIRNEEGERNTHGDRYIHRLID